MARPPYKAPVPPCTIHTEIEPGKFFLIDTMPPAEMLKDWSANTGYASSRVFLSGDHFTHVYGPHSETYQLRYEIDHVTGECKDFLPRLLIAQEAVKRLIGKRHKKYSNPGWTYSRLANLVTDWLDISQISTQRETVIQIDADSKKPLWNYQSSRPKLMRNPEGGKVVLPYSHATMYDLRGAYWQIWQRIPCPKYFIDLDGEIHFASLAVEQQRRWDRMHKVLDSRALKLLHNAIVGTNVRGWRGMHVDPLIRQQTTLYQRGEAMPMPTNPGPLMPLSLLTVRCVYELTQIQSEMCQSIYSNIDCIVTEFDGPPRYWDEMGMTYRKAAEGLTVIRRPASRYVGGDYTEQFTSDEVYNMYLAVTAKRYENPYLHRKVLGL